MQLVNLLEKMLRKKKDMIIKENQPQVLRKEVENVKRVRKREGDHRVSGSHALDHQRQTFPQSVKIYQ